MNARFLVVDGHSVIFQWPELRNLHTHKQAAARELLIRSLQNLHAISEWRVTLVLDGTVGSQRGNVKEKRRPEEMVVIYANAHQTADSIIERLVAASGVAPAITVITADEAERNMVESLGAFCASPDWLRLEMERNDSHFSREMEKVHRAAKWR